MPDLMAGMQREVREVHKERERVLEQVAGVLGYVEKNHAANALAIVKAYQRLITAEVAKGSAVVEHAGPISDTVLSSIAGALSQRYHRPVTTTASSSRRDMG